MAANRVCDIGKDSLVNTAGDVIRGSLLADQTSLFGSLPLQKKLLSLSSLMPMRSIRHFRVYQRPLVPCARASNAYSCAITHKPGSQITRAATMPASIRINGDLNNTEVLRSTEVIPPDPAYLDRSLAIPEDEDDLGIRTKYRSFLLNEAVTRTDWVSKLELSTVLKLSNHDLLQTNNDRLRVLVLYGSLRNRSYSRLLAYEASRILHRLGCDVRVFNPSGLPVKDDVQHGHDKVQELRELSKWSDGHVWVSPEQHGNLTAVFKNQIDWIPLSSGSVRPTQGRTLAIAQVSGGSQSFNTVNSLRMLGRWMRMFAIPNQSSVPKAYTQFTDAVEEGDEQYVELEGGSRLVSSGNRDRLVDCMEEFVKYTIVMRPHFGLFGDRYSEREERRVKGEKAKRVEDEKAGVEGNAKSIASAQVVNGVDVNGI